MRRRLPFSRGQATPSPASAFLASGGFGAVLPCARQPAAPHLIRAQLGDFYTWCVSTDIPEVHRLASNMET